METEGLKGSVRGSKGRAAWSGLDERALDGAGGGLRNEPESARGAPGQGSAFVPQVQSGGLQARPGWRARLRSSLLSIPIEETLPERRGFQVDTADAASRITRVGANFLEGYHAALLDPDPARLGSRLEREIPPGWRGFAFEGAGMALALQDAILPRAPWRPSRVRRFVEGSGFRHRYLVLVGAGWSFGRIPRRYGRALVGLDPLLRWLAFDGYGFHNGFFHWRRFIQQRRRPRRLRGYGLRSFDQGLGRSLWFVLGMNPERIAEAIETFPATRRGDLWSGVGLACGYAGGLPVDRVMDLRRLAGPWLVHAAQGAAFAAKARLDADEGTPELELACSELCGASAAEVAAKTGELMAGLPDEGGDLASSEPAYEVWRMRLREHLATHRS